VKTTLPQTFSYSQARAIGLSKRAVYDLRNSGEIESIGRGVYRRADAELADLDLLLVAERAPMATLCLTSALARHELTDEIPSAHDIALPRGAWRPQVDAIVNWHSFAAKTFEVGRGSVQIDGDTSIGLFDATRSIVDAFRMRSDLGSDTAYEALRRWLRRTRNEPADLIRTAQHFPAALAAIRAALEVLQ
jgi:predicted transcriptional regulator of viral defense system